MITHVLAGSVTVKGRRGGVYVKVEKIIMHPQYIGISRNDIALLYLSSPINENANSIKFASLFPGEFPNGRMLNVSGWGYYDERYILSNDLLTAEVPTRPVKDCKHAGPDKICAGGLPPNFTDACAGDSGGPLSLHQRNQYFVVGIVSYGNGHRCGTRGSFGGYQKVSHHLNWIKEVSGVVPSLNFNMTLNKK
jgi:hypothetical protein